MAAEQDQKVLELVVFKLRDGATNDQLLATVDRVSDWVKTQPGFISRDLTYSASEDRWIEVIWWDSLEEAESAAAVATSSDSCAPMFGLIDMESALYLHGEPVIAPVAVKASRSS
jgi:hypothetical protein